MGFPTLSNVSTRVVLRPRCAWKGGSCGHQRGAEIMEGFKSRNFELNKPYMGGYYILVVVAQELFISLFFTQHVYIHPPQYSKRGLASLNSTHRVSACPGCRHALYIGVGHVRRRRHPLFSLTLHLISWNIPGACQFVGRNYLLDYVSYVAAGGGTTVVPQ